jgi:hypothetical protein
MDSQLDFLTDLRDRLHGRFPEPAAEQLFIVAASELLAGPEGVTAEYASTVKRFQAKN